jgi:hypothetical protein
LPGGYALVDPDHRKTTGIIRFHQSILSGILREGYEGAVLPDRVLMDGTDDFLGIASDQDVNAALGDRVATETDGRHLPDERTDTVFRGVVADLPHCRLGHGVYDGLFAARIFPDVAQRLAHPLAV